jgi:hypothetical protein
LEKIAETISSTGAFASFANDRLVNEVNERIPVPRAPRLPVFIIINAADERSDGGSSLAQLPFPLQYTKAVGYWKNLEEGNRVLKCRA